MTEVGLVVVHEALIEARHQRGVSQIVVADEVDGATKQPTALIDVLPPDFMCKPCRAAVVLQGAAERHAIADADGSGVRR